MAVVKGKIRGSVKAAFGKPAVKKKTQQGVSLGEGETYAPKQPAPAPTPTPPEEKAKGIGQNIVFNPDKSVNIDGKTLTPEEYKGYDYRGGGKITPQVEQLQLEREKARLMNMGDVAGLRKLAQNENLRAYIAEQRGLGRGISEISQNLIAGELQETTPITTQEKEVPFEQQYQEKKASMQAGTYETAADTIVNKIADIPITRDIATKSFQAIASISQFLPEMLQIGTKKSPAVTAAESTFDQANQVISKDIELAKMGMLNNPQNALADIDKAMAAIVMLERQTTGIAKANPRYWVTEGAELEASILAEKRMLQNQRADLDAAIKANQLNQQKIIYGI